MVKNLIVSLITLLLPIITIISVYRFLIGYGPLNSKAIIQIFGDSFQGTSDRFSLLLDTLSEIYEMAQPLSGGFGSFLPPQENAFLDVLTKLYNSFVYSFNFLISLLVHIGDILSAIGGLVFFLLSDVIEFLRVLTVLLIDSSPYVVDPYYPVG